MNSVSLTMPLPSPTPSGAGPTGLDAQGAAASPGAGQVPPQALQAPSALQAALAATRLSAATKQDGLAALMANAVSASNLPPDVQTAVQQLTALHLFTDKMPGAADVKTAIAASGLFTEALIAAGTTLPKDLKTALFKLNQAARDWQARIPDGPQQDVPTPNPSVPPPVRGAGATAQAPASPTLPKSADAALTAQLLADGSTAALARQDLLQLASLPEEKHPNELRWVVDMPLMTPQGPAVAQLTIQRDEQHNSGSDAPKPIWRVGLALDIEPLGPVRANLALRGDHAWVTIAASRPDALAKLQKDAGWLTQALHGAALEADIAFQAISAKPTSSRPPIVDHAS